MQKVHSVYNGTENLSHLGPKVCRLIPHEIAPSVLLGDFKSKIISWDSSWFFLQTTQNTIISNRIYLKNFTLKNLTIVSTVHNCF